MRKDIDAMLVSLILVLMIPIQAQDAYMQSSSNNNGNNNKNNNGSSNANLRIDISTIPSKLVKGSEGFLLVQIYNNNEPAPFVVEIQSITSSDPEVLSIDKDSIERVGNSLMIKVVPLKSGSTIVTLVTKDLNLKPISKEIYVYESIDKPSKLGLTVKPSSFSYLGPLDGYIAVQLLNALDEPVVADKDYNIWLSSSNTSILDINTNIRISKGENFAYMHFTVNAKNNGTATVTARYGDMIASADITFEGTQGKVLRLYAVDIAPALKGQVTYAFVQLQDSNGRVIYADRDINVEVRADTKDIIGGTGVIRKGESTAIVKLIVNTDNPCVSESKVQSACISLVAISKDMVSEPVKIDLREPIIEDYTSHPKSIGNDYLKIYAQLFPSSMPIIADGKNKVIGAIQLISYSDNASKGDRLARPVIASTDTVIDLISSNKLAMMDTKVTIPKGRSMELVTASMGYNASSTKVSVLADYLENGILDLDIQGHKDVSIVAEPLIGKIPYAIPFPYVIYFKDSEGKTSYVTDDINVRIDTDGMSIKQGSNSLKKGGSTLLIELEALRKGNVKVYLEAIGINSRYESYSSIDVAYFDNSNITLDMYMQDVMLVGSKYLASVQLLYKDYPFSADEDTRIIVFSNSNNISTPTNISIVRGKYFTFFTIEVNYKSDNKVNITVLADGFNSINKEINVIEDRLSIKLDSNESVNKMDVFDVTLNVSYANMPLSNMSVKWNADLAVLTSIYDDVTDSNGIAKAKFLAYNKGTITISARVYGYGIERSASIKVNSIEEKGANSNNSNNNGNDIIANSSITTTEENNKDVSIFNNLTSKLPIDAEYLVMFPALAGIVIWFVNKKRVKLNNTR